MSRAKYLKYLEHDLEVSMKVINDLTQENYELKELLKSLLPTNNGRSTKVQAKQPQAA